MSSTVTVGGLEVTSNSDTAASMVESLKPTKEGGKDPRVLVDSGKTTEGEDQTEEQKAAAVLGRKGGEAAAAKRAAAAKEAEKAKPADKDDDDIAEAEKAEKEGKLGKPRHDARARMLEKAREAKALKAEVEKERAERVRLSAELEQARAPKPVATPEPVRAAPAKADDSDPEPKEEDFEDYKSYVKATGRWAARQEFSEQRKANEQHAIREVRDRSVNHAFKSFFGTLDEAAKADPSFTEKTLDFVGSLQPSPMLADGQKPTAFNDFSDEILTSKHAPALTVYFAEHPDEVNRIKSLPTRRDVLREVARIEGRLDAAPTATAPRAEVSKASEPVRPVTGRPTAAEPDIYGDMPFETFVQRRQGRASR